MKLPVRVTQTHQSLKRRCVDGASVLLLVTIFLGIASIQDRKLPLRNPDRYYHFAISKMTLEQGVLGSLEQLPDLGWDRHFPEKEFLFHQVTALGYRFGGEAGVVWSCRIVVAIGLILLFLTIRQYVSPLTSISILLGLLLLNAHLAFRFAIIRPHTLAVTMFIACVYGVLQRKWILTLLAGAGFGLAYHAFYVPAAFFLVLAAFEFLSPADEAPLLQNTTLRCCAAGLLGIFAALILSPYFPHNIEMAWNHLTYALANEQLSGVHVGAELLPLSADYYLKNFGAHLAIALVSVGILIREMRKSTPGQSALATVSTFSLGFIALAIQSPRTADFGAPLTCIALALTWQFLPKLKAIRVGILIALLIAVLPSLLPRLLREPDRGVEKISLEILHALEVLPDRKTNRKIFNCDWVLGSFILYARPGYQFVDLLDPRFLLHANPKKFEEKRLLKVGLIKDPFSLIYEDFKADYVLCSDPNINKSLSKDPRFRKIYPTSPRQSSVNLFTLESP